MGGAAVAIDRASPSDLTTLVTDVGAAPMQVGAVLCLDGGGGGVDASALARVLGERLGSIPRMRQRLADVPFGLGRPIWVDDPEFDLDRHLSTVPCPGGVDRKAVLELAAAVVTARLDRSRPLWSAVVVTDAAGRAHALVVVFHHVLADGIGGLAMLASLVDGVATPVPPSPARPGPTHTALARDAARSRLQAFTRLPGALRSAAGLVASLRKGSAPRAAPCSLNRPTGPRRAIAHVGVALQPVVDTAHASGSTVNDVLLAAITAALRDLLDHRGEAVEQFVVSIPVSHRRATTVDDLGNSVGAVPVALPARGDPPARLRRIAATTREAKQSSNVASVEVLLGPVFRLLARLRLFGWFIGRQRMVHTFVTNLRGPAESMALAGVPITEVMAVAVVPGNVTVSFAVLSYAGRMGVTIVADPDGCPDLELLEAAVERRLAELTGLASGGAAPATPGEVGQR